MLRGKKAKKVLTKKQQKHLTEMGINSMYQFEMSREHQAIQKRENPGSNWGRCFECDEIARRLGVS